MGDSGKGSGTQGAPDERPVEDTDSGTEEHSGKPEGGLRGAFGNLTGRVKITVRPGVRSGRGEGKDGAGDSGVEKRETE